MSFDLKSITRKNIWELTPYSSARDEFTGTASVYLDANENPNNNGLNRYPDPYQWELKDKIAGIKNIKKEQIILGNGSDEIIDLIFRAFCEPQVDHVISISPSYGMYKVYAEINNVENKPCLLTEDFEIDEAALLGLINNKTKVIWFCSPNNPTGNSLNPDAIKKVLNSFDGIVVIDEAYIDFSFSQTWVDFLDFHPNLIVMQTLSKAWGLAAIRLGMGFASKEIISLLNKIKPPYNINALTQSKAIEVLQNIDQKNIEVDEILAEREKLSVAFEKMNSVTKVYPSDANFILIKIENADHIYNELVKKSIIIRNRSKVELCSNCLRITVGTPTENNLLLKEIEALTASNVKI